MSKSESSVYHLREGFEEGNGAELITKSTIYRHIRHIFKVENVWINTITILKLLLSKALF